MLAESDPPYQARTTPAAMDAQPVFANFRVLDQDTPACCLARGPFGKKVQQPRIIRLGGLVRMRPITPPQHPLRRGLDLGLADLVDIRIGGRTDLA
jgi:hypothetical protein